LYRYVLKRLLQMIPVMLGVTFIVFVLMYYSPGDPAQLLLGEKATAEEVARLREEMGLNDPLLVQFGRYVKGIVTRFDFGRSYVTKEPVVNEILARFPNTARLASLGVLVSVVIGITSGIIAATRQYSIFDNIATAVSLLGVSIPSFWLGLMLMVLFAIKLNILPASGSYGWKYWILPVITVGTNGAASIMRMTRSSMLEVIRQDYIRTVRAKGQTERLVILRHALKNALIPVVTVIGIQFGFLLGGSVLTETVFSIPGLGKYGIDAIRQRDIPATMGSVLFLSLTFGLVNLVVDILYSYIDPRIKSQYRTERSSNQEKKVVVDG
jgi:peptide/nickel transport system permease protein